MFSRVISKRVIGVQTSTRSLHLVPKLDQHKQWSSEGISGLYSPKQFKMAWTDYQNYLLTNLTLLTNGTPYESKQTYQVVLNSAKRTTDQHIFHYASQAHSNHLFFQQLTSKDKAQETKPSKLLMQKLINQDINDVETLRSRIISLGSTTFGQGWLFLVEFPDKQIKLIRTNNDGTPYYYGKTQELDLNGGVDEPTYKYLENLKQRAINEEQEFTLPVLAINLWDQAYIQDYGVNGRQKYLENVFDCIDWNVINERLFLA
ncbi:37S ribosomal protein S26 mitochondrial [Spathaspora sp. JA1]|nr:37S ribosomal protein S26 mitochondrial [Spathaspora sp. JA1]